MQARYDELTVETQGDGEIVDLTSYAQKALANHGFSDGLCTVFVAHSTCGVTTIEYEPGCNQDSNDTPARPPPAPPPPPRAARHASGPTPPPHGPPPRAGRARRTVGHGSLRRRRAAAR